MSTPLQNYIHILCYRYNLHDNIPSNRRVFLFNFQFMSAQNSKLRTQNHNVKLKTNVKYRSYVFSVTIIKFIDTLPYKQSIKIIKDQLIRSSTSIGANIFEAKSSSSKRDFIKFYTISLKSANETKYWLCLLRDTTENYKDKIQELLKEVNEMSNMLGSSLLTLKNKRKL